MFKDMFSLPPGPNAEGTSESNPIVMSGCTNFEFTSLMSILIGPRFEPLSLTVDQWIGVLKLATVWDMPKARAYAIASVAGSLTPISQVRYGREFRVKEWFLGGCLALTRPGGRQPIAVLAASLGWETAARILDACQRTSEKARLTGVTIPVRHFRCDECSRSLALKDVDAIQTTTRRFDRHELVLTILPIPGKSDPGWAQRWYCGICKASGKLTLDLSGVAGSGEEENLEIVKEVFKKDLADLIL